MNRDRLAGIASAIRPYVFPTFGTPDNGQETPMDKLTVVLPHRWEIGTRLSFVSIDANPDLVLQVIGRNFKERRSGNMVSYLCKQFRSGIMLNGSIEVDESDVREA